MGAISSPERTSQSESGLTTFPDVGRLVFKLMGSPADSVASDSFGFVSDSFGSCVATFAAAKPLLDEGGV
jgi:hypothetical protein